MAAGGVWITPAMGWGEGRGSAGIVLTAQPAMSRATTTNHDLRIMQVLITFSPISANPRQLLSDHHIDDPRRSDRRAGDYHTGVFTHGLADDGRVLPERMRTHGVENS